MHIKTIEQVGAKELRELGDVLIDCVEGGASVSFMWPMTRAKADAYWQSAAREVEAGSRIILAAWDASGIAGTVSVILRLPENQPHRAEIAKMLVHRRARRQGVGAALLAAAEAAAAERGKRLLVLDTVSESEAARLYARQGWQRCGEIPHFALWPDGRECPTTIFYKEVVGSRRERRTSA